MKLLNHTTKYFSIALFLILGAWSVIFYLNILDEVYDSLDDGLENYKMLIIEKAHKDSTVLHKNEFEESNYSIREISKDEALRMKDVYRDTLLYMQNEEDYEPVRLLTSGFELHGKYYQLSVITSMVEEDDLIEDLLYAIIWLYAAMLVSIVLVNNILFRHIWKPFYHLLDQLTKFRPGKDSGITSMPSIVEEFKVLNETTQSLISRTLETFKNQKEFIENASHELQTPLAISMNKLELLAEKNSLSESDLAAIGTVIQTLERLSRLNKSLLLLSKIENQQFENTQLVNLNALVHSTKQEFEEYAAFRNVTISIQEEGVFEKVLHADLAQIMITNLIKNAIVHNHPEGTVTITITIAPASLTIANTGKMEALQGEKIFDRFHKETHEGSSTGLGLAIVKAIAIHYGFLITYQYNQKHIFKIVFS